MLLGFQIYNNILKRGIINKQSQNCCWQNQIIKNVKKNLFACESTYNKHLGDQIMLERLQTLIVGYWSKLKASCIIFACPIRIARPSNFVKFFVIYVHDYLICKENFHCNDVCVASCGHCYHPWCLTIQCTSQTKCQVKGCDQEFDPSWQLSFGFFNKV